MASACVLSIHRLLFLKNSIMPIMPIRFRHTWSEVPWKEWYSYEGKEEPLDDVHDRFKRLNHGVWIHGSTGWHRKLYRRSHSEIKKTRHHVAVQFKGYDHMIFRMSSPFYRRPKFYAPSISQECEPYEPYQRRFGMEKHGYTSVPKFLP